MSKDNTITIDGIDVVDAEADFPLVITEKHAKNGKPLDIENCPGAMACLENIQGALAAKVYKSRIFVLRKFNGNELWERYIVPKSLMIQEAIIDNGGRFSPGVYVLKAPTASSKTGRQQGSNKRPPKDPSKPKQVRHKTPMRENAPTSST